MTLYSGVDWVCFVASVFGFGLRGTGFGVRASGFGLWGFGALGLHGFGIEVASCVYSGNGGYDIGYIIFLLRLY